VVLWSHENSDGARLLACNGKEWHRQGRLDRNESSLLLKMVGEKQLRGNGPGKMRMSAVHAEVAAVKVLNCSLILFG
jgi:hypothetical protein